MEQNSTFGSRVLQRPRDWGDRAVTFWREHPDRAQPLATLVMLGGVLFVAYWQCLSITAGRWDDPLYSHGYVVPLFAAALLWMRREPLSRPTPAAQWAGLGLLASGLGLWLASTHFAFITPMLVSFVPSLAGVFLLAGGWRLMRWAGPAVAFLVFMFPLPSFIKEGILERLQHLATIASTFALQTLGVAAHHEGNRILIGELKMGVVDACSGLRMSTNLLALVVAVLLITKRPWWDRVIVLISAVPLALAVNVVRITATGLIFLAFGTDRWGEQFHHWSGFAMMPLAIGLLYLELVVLSKLIIEDDDGSDLAAAGIGLK